MISHAMPAVYDATMNYKVSGVLYRWGNLMDMTLAAFINRSIVTIVEYLLQAE